jgi:putative hydrolase of the HAD superfamily
MRVQAICFDFDGTLAHYTGDFSLFLDGLRSELMLTQCDMKSFAERLRAELKKDGAVTLESALTKVLEELELRPPADLPDIAHKAARDYGAEVALLPGAAEVLKVASHVPLALISNGPEDMQRAALEQTGIASYFRAVLISGDRDVYARKPAARIFYLALTGLEVNPEDALMIGDNLAADIEGARAVGMRALYLGQDAGGLPSVPDLEALSRYLRAELGMPN